MWQDQGKNDDATVAQQLKSDLEELREEQKITRQEILKMIRLRGSTPSINLVQGLFGNDITTAAEANSMLINKLEHLDLPPYIDRQKINFNETMLEFSSFGTAGFVNHLDDRKTSLVYYASGLDKDRMFIVRKGIGWFYREYLGAQSFLGFPVSNEFQTKGDNPGDANSNFEGGYIKYIEALNKIQVFRYGIKGESCVMSHSF